MILSSFASGDGGEAERGGPPPRGWLGYTSSLFEVKAQLYYSKSVVLVVSNMRLPQGYETIDWPLLNRGLY